MSCLIKNIPDSAKALYGTGNKGLFFPVSPVCEIIDQPEIPFCYLVLEEDGITQIDQQENNDVFLTDCINL